MKELAIDKFNRRNTLISILEDRIKELKDNLSSSEGLFSDKRDHMRKEYLRLKSGIYFFVTRQYDQEFDNSQELFKHIQSHISINLEVIRETIINHINNNHTPQDIDIRRFEYITKVQEDWQKYMNLIINVVE